MDKLNANRLIMNEDFKGSELKRENLAAIYVSDCYVWPRVNQKIIVSDLFYENTIYLSLINDKNLVIVPSSNLDCPASIVELINTRKTENNTIEIEVVGIRRLRVTKFFRATLENIVLILNYK